MSQRGAVPRGVGHLGRHVHPQAGDKVGVDEDLVAGGSPFLGGTAQGVGDSDAVVECGHCASGQVPDEEDEKVIAFTLYLF